MGECKEETTMQLSNLRRVATGLAVVAVVISLAAGITSQLRAQPPTAVESEPFRLDGYRASSSAPFVVTDHERSGEGGIFTLVGDPILSTQTLDIPAPTPGTGPGGSTPSDFGGASCSAAFRQMMLTTDNGASSLGMEGFEQNCLENIPPGTGIGSHFSHGIITCRKNGSGKYSDVFDGAGTYALELNADGSGVVHVEGNLMRKR
jgi:hypothetical protein